MGDLMTCYEMYFVHSLDKVLPNLRPEMLRNPVLKGFSVKPFL